MRAIRIGDIVEVGGLEDGDLIWFTGIIVDEEILVENTPGCWLVQILGRNEPESGLLGVGELTAVAGLTRVAKALCRRVEFEQERII